MLKTKNSLYLVFALLFVLGYCSSAFATDNMAVSPNVSPDPNWELKADPDHEEVEVPLVDPDPTPDVNHEEAELERLSSKTSTIKTTPIPELDGFADLLTEGFEGGVVPPTGWSAIVNNPYTWDTATYAPYEGSYYASCLYDETYSGNQDEWLISPDIDLTGINDAVLDFWWNGSYYWSVDPYPNCTLSVFVTTDGGSNWTMLWYHHDYGLFTTWEWNNTVLGLSAYENETINIAFVYTGYDGAQFSVDAVSINNDPLPVGRCCYGDPQAPSCADVTEVDCEGLGGWSWDQYLNCTDNPCPVAGVGDDCSNPLTITLPADMPYTDAGQFTCGRVDDYAAADMCYTYGYGGGEDIVYEVTVTETVNIEMTMDPKGTTWTYVEIRTECVPPNGDCIYYFRSTAGAEYYSDMVELAPGTYYILIDTWPSPDCIPDFDFSIDTWVPPVGRCCYGDPQAPSCADVTEAECADLGGEWNEELNCTDDPCPIVGVGDNCSTPIEVKVPGDLPLVDTNFTCDRQNFYNNTCLGSYDGGEDIIYWLDVDAPVCIDIIFDPMGTTWTGIAIADACPLPSGSGDCIAKVTGSSGTALKEIRGLELMPGSYYIMIDTWPSPTCIPEFELTIDTCAGGPENDDWDKCEEIGDVENLEYSTSSATVDGPETCQYAPNVWYCYTATCSGEAVASLCGSGYDTKMAVYDGTDPYTAPMIECNDDFCGLQSEIHWTATAGNTYLIEVGGYSSNTGSGVITTYCIPDTCVVPNAQDQCTDVTPVVLTMGTTHTYNWTNECGTNEAPGVLGDNSHTWEAFTLTTGADVVLDYCGTSPSFELVYIILFDGCPIETANQIFADSTNWNLCGGDGNVTMYFTLPAGTYYYPVLADHPSYPTTYYEGPYTINVLATYANLTFDPEDIDFGIVGQGATGGTTLTLGAEGSRDINFAIDILWGDKDRSTNHENNSLGTTPPEKPEPNSNYVPGEGRAGGETIATATAIGAMPYTDSDNSCDFINDYDEVCPYSGSTAPDAVYSFSPSVDSLFDISLCNSGYDTKLYIYQNSYTPGAPYACNDDGCPGYRSLLEQVPMYAGDTYYIVVDGYGSACGDYLLEMDYYVPPQPFACPEGSFDENEPCGTDFNGGCNMVVPAFEPIACGDTVCGWGWADFGTRDTDWYLLTMYQDGPITLTCTAEFEFVVGFVETAVLGDPDCATASALNPYATGNPGDVVSVTLPSAVIGDYWLFVGPLDYYDNPCDGSNERYWMTPDCDPGEAPIIWLTVDQMSGTVPQGGTLDLAVDYNTAELPVGVHTAQLLFTHDGNQRAEDIVPVQIEVGIPGTDTMQVHPDPIYAMMEYNYEDSMRAQFYLGGEFAPGGLVVEDINVGLGLTINGSIAGENPTILEYVEGFSGHVLGFDCKMSDFLATYPHPLWDEDDYDVAVTYFVGSDPFEEHVYCTMIGHTSGDANFDGAINMLDVTYMIAYVYMSGPAPIPISETGDVDGNGFYNILDIVYYLNYLYKNGPAPTHP